MGIQSHPEHTHKQIDGTVVEVQGPLAGRGSPDVCHHNQKYAKVGQ